MSFWQIIKHLLLVQEQSIYINTVYTNEMPLYITFTISKFKGLRMSDWGIVKPFVDPMNNLVLLYKDNLLAFR